MSIETNKSLARRFYVEVLNARRSNTVDDLAVAEYVEHDPLPGQRDNREGLKDRVRTLTEALSPTFTIEDIVAEDDRVVVRWTNRGTHVAPFLGIPPTGRAFEIAGVDIYRVENNRLAEHWHVVDQLTMLQQLGLLPTPETAPA